MLRWIASASWRTTTRIRRDADASPPPVLASALALTVPCTAATGHPSKLSGSRVRPQDDQVEAGDEAVAGAQALFRSQNHRPRRHCPSSKQWAQRRHQSRRGDRTEQQLRLFAPAPLRWSAHDAGSNDPRRAARGSERDSAPSPTNIPLRQPLLCPGARSAATAAWPAPTATRSAASAWTRSSARRAPKPPARSPKRPGHRCSGEGPTVRAQS